MQGLSVRHGYPLTLIAWDPRQPIHFAPAHAVADLAFWYLAWTIATFLLVLLIPRSTFHTFHALRPFRRFRPRRHHLPHPVLGGPSEPAGSDTSGSPSTGAPVARDESVGGLP
jgi:hypothetical protein